MTGLSVWLVSGCAHVFVLISVPWSHGATRRYKNDTYLIFASESILYNTFASKTGERNEC